MRIKLFVPVVFGLLLSVLFLNTVSGQNTREEIIFEENKTLYDNAVDGIHITPGAWRPLFNKEHIAWINPPWASEKYVWLDFPEAIFSGQDLLFLGHISQRFPSKYNDLEKAAWQITENGIQYKQQLPDGISFGGSVTKKDKITVELKLWIHNDGSKPLKDIKLQTCAYLNAIDEYNEKSNSNKLVHVPGHGWLPFEEARQVEGINSNFRVGWREGPAVADLPVIITQSKQKDHLIAMTWFENTYSFIGNENHPCFHADPFISDLAPGEKKTITGQLIFFEGSIAKFEKIFRQRLK